MVDSVRGVNGQGRVLNPSVAAVETGSNGRAPFFSYTRALAGLVDQFDDSEGAGM